MDQQSTQDTQAPAPPAPPLQIVRDDDYTNLYANNLHTELSVWDLKVIFGILDQSSQPNKIVQHTAINLPWAQVKLASYYLQVAVILHEAQNARINIPVQLRPIDPSIIKQELADMPPEAKEKIANIYKSFMASL